MNTAIRNTSEPATELNVDLEAALLRAQEAVRDLSRDGVTAFYVVVQADRKPTLLVDRMPDGVAYATKQRYPNGRGGTTVIDAAVHLGCQLEWMHDVYSDAQVAHINAALGAGPKAVPNG